MTVPTVILPPRPRHPHLLPPAKLVPAGFGVGGNTSPSLLQRSPSELSDDDGTAFPAARGMGCVSLPPSSAPTIMLPSEDFGCCCNSQLRRSITLSPRSHAYTIGEFRRWCGTAPLMLHRRRVAIDARQTPLVPRARG